MELDGESWGLGGRKARDCDMSNCVSSSRDDEDEAGEEEGDR